MRSASVGMAVIDRGAFEVNKIGKTLRLQSWPINRKLDASELDANEADSIAHMQAPER